ncbi:MAG TPA: ATP-binding domain-containing protein [Actinomycetota bacterium]|nr:ATP-binding domain-containing protein [Actinomycetota bacterium]
MALEVVQGQSRDRLAATSLARTLAGTLTRGTLYLGYPVLATADEKVVVDALLVSPDHGLVAFLIADALPVGENEWDEIVEAQDRLFAVLESSLRRHDTLRRGRYLAIDPQTGTVFGSQPTGKPQDVEGFYGSLEQVVDWIASLPPIDPERERALQAALQRVTTIKPRKTRQSVQRTDSRGAVLREIERSIANLDQWQKAAAIESPEGPQRIRGLAGSGKTVVLALKAAYWHTQHPEWKIALTFHTRALYQQLDDLVTRFTFEHSSDKPDPSRLRIIHAWGSRNRPGVYSMIAAALDSTPRDWAYARNTYGFDNAFQGVCQELLRIANARDTAPIFDAVLIDEAQDLPSEFFQLVYRFTKNPKRIVWAYDELQRLSEAAMPDTAELFGTGPNDEPLVSLEAPPDGPRRDIVLPVCYRNTPWALAAAHAVGLGIYRENGPLQHPDDPKVWKDIGYSVVHGRLETGEHVVLERAGDSYPAYFTNLIDRDDAVILQVFEDEQRQDEWVADEIVRNIGADELDPDDILIVLPDVRRARERAPRLIRLLSQHGIQAHLAGVNSSVDEIFIPGSIAIAHIHRAKGNEAPIVYAMDAQYCARGFNAVTRRNTLFTAITRSRAWVRVTGWGDQASVIGAEIRKVKELQYKLDFTIPTPEQLATLRHLHREKPAEAEVVIKRTADSLTTFFEALERGDVDMADLPPAIRTRLAARIHEESIEDESQSDS